MSITESARNELNVRIVPHAELAGEGVLLPNGLIKTPKGLLIPPSQSGASTTHTGRLAALTPAEQQLFPEPVQPQTQQREPEPEQRGRGRRRGRQQPQPTPSKPVLLKLTLDGVGTIPSQYVHVYVGKKTVILGMNEYSYIPAVTQIDENGKLVGSMRTSMTTGTYAYAGQSFVDDKGVTNLILVEMED